MAQAIGRDIPARMPYLARDPLYTTEKPYGADFPVDHFEGSQLANHIYDPWEVTVFDIRGASPAPCLDRNGFCLLNEKVPLPIAEASNEKTPAMDLFLLGIERMLYKSFPHYSRIEVMDFQIRKRAEGFPGNIGQKVETEQPASLPHTDFSLKGAFMRMEEAFPGQEEHYKAKVFDLLNVWRVLKGPNDDWPLTLCDYQTLEFTEDAIGNDCLHQTRVGENWLLRGNSAHKWYYVSAQTEDDLLVFRNVDSEGKRPCAFHAAVDNVTAKCDPRQSVEVRVVAFR